MRHSSSLLISSKYSIVLRYPEYIMIMYGQEGGEEKNENNIEAILIIQKKREGSRDISFSHCSHIFKQLFFK
jgi:hypothetical protein